MVSWTEFSRRPCLLAGFLGIRGARAGRVVAIRCIMRSMLSRILVLGSFALVILTAAPALAITVDQVLALKKAGVTDTVILALIDRDRTVFAIEPEQILSLQRDGLTEKIILAMLKSGREEGDQAARADAANTAAWIASNLATEPISVS